MQAMGNHLGQDLSVQKISLLQWVSIVFAFLPVPLILFTISRDLGWWQAWVYSIVVFIVGVGGRFMAERRHPGLLAERMRFGRKQEVKAWDRVLEPLMGFSVLYPLMIVAGLDHYYHWTTPFPIWVNGLAFIITGLGYALGVWALVENRYFSMMVRIQMDRGHKVCDTGPYRYLRHPGYAGNMLPLLGIAVALDSWWTLIPVLFAFIITIIRTALEDRTLINELPGYREYTLRVRYRLVPGIW
jgi:protein-S-isoprenylcysteine O-methyltransferase Ste14